jgi:signal transduction histidine kinase/DNA-binding response OmpR family regulator
MERLHSILNRINAWLNYYLHLPGDSQETILQKKIWWLLLVTGLPVLIILSAIIGNKEGIGVVIVNYTWAIWFFSMGVIFHFYRKNIKMFAIVTQIGIVLLASVKIYMLGGLLYAGTPIFIGLISPLYALTFPEKKRAVFVFLLYVVLIVLATLLQDEAVENYVLNYNFFGFIIGMSMIFIALYYYTDRVETLKLEEKIRMRELDEFKTKFYNNITHEFRTPLTIILGMVDQIKNNPEKYSDSGFEMIKRNGRHLLNLTNQMLDLSKLEANEMPVNLIQDDITMYLKYLVESFYSLASAKNIKLSFKNYPEEIYMDFDPDKLRDIVSNLVSNAIKFTPDGGHVQVSVSIQQESGSHQLILAVKDTGIGIKHEHLPKVFNRYFQLENYQNQQIEGTGLGLALTKELVKLLKGEIKVYSAKNTGTVFTVLLPITNRSTYEHPNLLKELEDIQSIKSEKTIYPVVDNLSEKLRLLIVEDNMDVVNYLHSLLSEYYNIEVAKNGLEGYNIAVDFIPDLVISDVMMPVLDGFGFCKKLKNDIRTSHIPVILLTARADVDSKMIGLKVGADVYLAKPFNRKELFVRIEKLIELRKKLQQRYQGIVTLNQNKDIGDAVMLKEDTFMKKVRKIMEIHISEDEFGIPELCKSIGMSRAQLYRKFSALTNTSVHHFIRKLRLVKAKELLLTTNLNVSEVAYDTGFKNPSHFSRIYSEEFGIAPSKTRA